MNIRPFFASAAFGLALLASSSTQAADDVGGRVVSGIGHWIAEQGNAALDELREELKRNLENTLKPLMPADPSSNGRHEAQSPADSAADAPAA